MAGHMNVFEPYAARAPHHEDALTRAFLLVLRAVPVAHASWLQMVDRAHRAAKGIGVPGLHELGTPDIKTQTARVESDVGRVILELPRFGGHVTVLVSDSVFSDSFILQRHAV
jgi:hypothetical protein